MVLVDGCFDPLHAGHIAYLDAAMELRQPGETLWCRIDPGGVKHPQFLDPDERAQIMICLDQIDQIVNGKTLSDAILHHRPRLLVKGRDWDGRLPFDVISACRQTETEVRYVDTVSASSTALLRDADEAALADLEAAYHEQTGATWTPITDYTLEGRRTAEGRHPDLLLEHLISPGDTVLDYGCGPGHLITLLRERQPDLTIAGYDPQDPDSEDALARTYDVVICREVLEHVPLRDWLYTLGRLSSRTRRVLYITTRHAAEPRSAFTLARRDDLDPTHITMLTQPFVRSLIALHGLQRQPLLERALDWQQQGRCLVYTRCTTLS